MANLPVELLSHILTFVPFMDKMNSMTVSRSWYIAARVALKRQRGFVIGSCMGNKHFCDGILKFDYLDPLSEQSVRVSQYKAGGNTEMSSHLSDLCPGVQILCDSGCDTAVSMLLLRAYRTKLRYLQLDSSVKKLHKVGVFPVLEYLKYAKLGPNIKSVGDTFPKLKYFDVSELTDEQIVSLPDGLKGMKLYFADDKSIQKISEASARNSLQVLHIITNKFTASVKTFNFPNLKDLSIRGLEDMGNLFVSLRSSVNLIKLHISARTCVTVDNNAMLNAFAALDHLTSLNLRFIILSDPVTFWTRMVQIFAHRLQHLTFSTHFVTSDSLRLISGFAALKTLSFPFIYDQPFIFNNVPENIRSRLPFDTRNLLQFFRTPTASKAILQDVSIHMQSLGPDLQVIRDLEAELYEMKQNHRLESAEIREVGNRNSIYV